MTLSPVAGSDDATALSRPRASTAVRANVLLDVLVLSIACAVFLALCLYQLDLPGLYPDEAFDVVPSMQILLGQPVEVQRGASVHLFGTDLPLMSSSDYQGVTSTYLVLPFFALGGVNVYSLRLMTILVGVLALILTFFLAKTWFGPAQARLAVLVMAVSPAWVFWSRVGVYVVSEVVPIATGALLALTIWVRKRPLGKRNGPLYLAAFLVGLGLTTKLLFLWMIVALAVCGFILYARPVWQSRHIWLREWKHWTMVALSAVVAFCSGAFPFLLYNALTRGTLHLLQSGINSPTTTYGVNNSAFLRNLWTEADAFKVLLDGGYFWFQGVAGHVYSNPLTPAIFAISAFGLLAIALAQRPANATVAAQGLRLPCALLAIALILAATLTIARPEGTIAHILIMSSIAIGVLSIVWLTLAALRIPELITASCWTLLAIGAISAATWWFGGANRPEGPDPRGPLGLWSVDTACVLFWLSGAALMIVLGSDSHPSRYQRPLVAILTITGLVVAQSAVTISGLWSTHLIVLLPLPQIAIVAFAVAILDFGSMESKIQNPKSKIISVLPATLIIAALIAFDLNVDFSYHRDLALTGGNTTFSDSIYRLADYLDKQNPSPKVIAMDWGFKRPIQLLTEDKINPVEIYGYSPEPTAGFRAGLRGLLTQPNTLYLFHTPESTAYPRFSAFQEEAKAAGKTVTLQQTFYLRDGKPNYLVYSVK